LSLGTLPGSAPYGSTLTLSATLTGAPVGSTVNFDIGQGPVPATTGATGVATTTITLLAPPGSYEVRAIYAGDDLHLPSSAGPVGFTETKASTALVLKTSRISIGIPKGTRAKLPHVRMDTGIYAALTTSGAPLPRKGVTFTLYNRLHRRTTVFARTTDGNGRAVLGIVDLIPGIYDVSAAFGTGMAGTAVDANYSASVTRTWRGVIVPLFPIRIA
jgi:hypothetical protein